VSQSDQNKVGMTRALDIAFPLALATLLLGAWEWAIHHWQVPHYVLPAPSAIAHALCENFVSLMQSLASTLSVTLQAFAAATVLGLVTAIGFTQSRLLERTLYPYAVILQVTPVVAIAPLILIWVGFDQYQPGAGDRRHPRRLLSHPGGRHPGTEVGGLQSAGSGAAAWRLATANSVAHPAAHRFSPICCPA